MDNKIQQLAEKIYQEGISKANKETEKIIAQAESQSKRLVEEANAEAEKIIAKAQEEAAQLRKQSEADVKNMVLNAEELLQTKITKMVNSSAVNQAVDEVFKDPKTLYNIVLEMARQMFDTDSQGVEIATSDAKALEEFFRAEAKEVLDQGVKIREVSGKPANFDLSPEGADYKINVSKEAFSEYFREFMRPRMRTILFGSEQA